MAVGDLYRIAIEGRLYNQQIINVFHIEEDVADPAVRTVDIGDAIYNRWVSGILPIVAAGYILQGYHALRILPVPSLAYVFNDTTHPAGAVTGQSIPPAASAVVSWRTGGIGRSYRGRTFIAGIPVGVSTNGEINVATQNALLSAATDLIDPYVVGAWEGSLSVYSKYQNHLRNDVITPITYATVNPVIRSQRRREIGVGS